MSDTAVSLIGSHGGHSLRACASRRGGAGQARAVMIAEVSHPAIIWRSRACPAIVGPGTPLGPDRRAAPHPPGLPPARLPPAPHRRPDRVRQAHPGAGVRLRVSPHRRPHLLGDHPATPTRRVDQHRGGRRTPLGGAGLLCTAVWPCVEADCARKHTPPRPHTPTQAARRWVIERTPAWANQYGKLRWCTERRRLVVEFWLALASAAIVCGRLVRRAWSCYRWDSRPRRRP